MGGLTVASLMAQLKGQRVLVLERHFRLGGFTHSFTRPGHRAWDVGLHYVGGMAAGGTGRQLFDFVTRGGVRWQKMPSPFEKFVYPDFTVDKPDDETSYRQTLIARYPRERHAIETYFRDLHAAAGWYGAQIVAQAVPRTVAALIRIASRPRRALALSTTRAYLDAHVRDPQLRAVLASQWGDYGLPPSESAFAIHALVVASYLDGGYYPIGGAGTIAQSVADIVEGHGGQCLINHRVTEIMISDGAAVGVRVEADKRRGADLEFTADQIVSDAGAYTTFCDLVPQSVPISFRAELERMADGHGFVTLYLAFKESPARLGFRGENHWIYDGYDHDALFKRHSDVPEGRPSGCYLSFQSLKDPEATAHTAEIIAFLDDASVERWKNQSWHKRGEDYDQVKHRVAEGLLDFVDRRYPGFKGLVDYCEVSTPVTVEHFTGHRRGSVYGIPATPERFRLPYLSVATPVRRLYLTGADVASLGITGAMMGGVATTARLLGSLGFFRIVAASKKYAASVLGVALGVCLFAAPARAQERKTVIFGSIGGAGLGHADSEQGNAPLFGGAVGFHLTPLLVVEGDVHRARVRHVFGRDHHNFTETTFTGSLLFQSTPDGRAHFIAGGGAGLQWAHTDVDDPPFRIDRSETIRLLHGRIGAAWEISSRMAIRTEGVVWFGEGLDWVLGARAGLGYRF